MAFPADNAVRFTNNARRENLDATVVPDSTSGLSFRK